MQYEILSQRNTNFHLTINQSLKTDISNYAFVRNELKNRRITFGNDALLQINEIQLQSPPGHVSQKSNSYWCVEDALLIIEEIFDVVR